MSGFVDNIEKLTLDNDNFRKVIFTAQHAQIVLMSLKPGEEIGMEVHEIVDQFLRIEKGFGKVIIDGEEQEISDGTGVLVPAGSRHNVVNTSQEEMKLYTIYAPPHHKDGVVHATKQEASADWQDHI